MKHLKAARVTFGQGAALQGVTDAMTWAEAAPVFIRASGTTIAPL